MVIEAVERDTNECFDMRSPEPPKSVLPFRILQRLERQPLLSISEKRNASYLLQIEGPR